MTIYHKHHIVPRHMGGTDDPSNIIQLTIEEHAEAHKILFDQYGHWQDELAYMGLSKLITHDEAVLISGIRANLGRKFSKEHKQKISDALKGHSPSIETRQKISQTRKDRNIPSSRLGAQHTDKAKAKIASSAKNRRKIQCSCGKLVDVANHARWHKICSYS